MYLVHFCNQVLQRYAAPCLPETRFAQGAFHSRGQGTTSIVLSCDDTIRTVANTVLLFQQKGQTYIAGAGLHAYLHTRTVMLVCTPAAQFGLTLHHF